MSKNKIEINDLEFEIVKNYKDAYNDELFKEKYTEYFDNFDYIFGDFSYDKLRLKGFNDTKNTMTTSVNDIGNLDDYIKNYCSYECRYFLLKKVNKNS